MYKILFTIDYEIHGNGDGSPYKMMVEPTERMMRLFDKYGAKLTIMADVAEILKFKEYKETYGVDKYDYDKVIDQLKYAVTNGHDVQLHIHSGYFKSEFTEKGIRQSWEEYDLANLSYDVIYNRIKMCKDFLETKLQEVNPDYKCIAFRAANWSMVPTKNIAKALINNGILIDTSVFKWGKRTGRVKFDYFKAPDKLMPWFISENDICEVDQSGRLLEVPIYTERRTFLAFISFVRTFRMIRARFHKHEKLEAEEVGGGDSVTPVISNSKSSKISKLIRPFTTKHAWKLDLNQSSGNQLIKAVLRIDKEYGANVNDIPIVLIGHSKSFIKYNEISFEPFLKKMRNEKEQYKFAIFSCINRELYR